MGLITRFPIPTDIINPIRPGISIFTIKPLNEMTKAISGSTPNFDIKKTNVPSRMPKPPIDIGKTLEMMTEIILISTNKK